MIHRLALLMGGTGAAGVLAAALSLGGVGAPLPNSPDAVPVSNNTLAGGQVAPPTPTDQPTAATNLGGGGPKHTTKKVIDTVYVVPAPAVHNGRPTRNGNEPTDTPRPSRDNNGGNQAGSDDQSNTGDGSYDGGQEPGDD